MAKLFVLSGGPCSGKTSLIKYLEKKGFPVLHETARKLVEIGIIKPEEFKSKEKRDYIQRIIFEEQLKAEESVSNQPVVFLDRSLVDGIAYYWILNLEPPKYMFEILSKKRYDKVFILEQLENFELDNVRHESPEQAKKIHELVIKAYEMLGYDIIEVPVMPIFQRAHFILKRIELF